MAPLDMSPEDVRLGGEHGGVSARDVELQRERGVLGGGALALVPARAGPKAHLDMLASKWHACMASWPGSGPQERGSLPLPGSHLPNAEILCPHALPAACSTR